jgi:5-methyltetrahydrofolate--homocysteine methyltransferase
VETTLRSASREVVIGPERPFALIGERINPTGRKVLAAELERGDLERVRADARAQVEAGAVILDVNAGVPGVDEAELLVEMIRAVEEVTDLPLSLDSSVPAALEAAMEVCKGKPLVNSVTGEEERLEKLLPLVKRSGAAVIGLVHDEAGISMDPEERLRIARRIVERAADHGIPAEDVVIDPLAMTVGANPDAGRVTLETIRLVSRELGNNLTLGASNASYGLPGRSVLNATFLAMAMGAGLRSAIANPLAAEVRETVLAADLFLGRDRYARAWIQAQRRKT